MMASRTSEMVMDGSSEYGLWRIIIASAVGTMIEWYDFYIFGSLAAVLSLKFYPAGNDTFAYVAYLATFAVGFLVRPFGALFFRRIGGVCCGTCAGQEARLLYQLHPDHGNAGLVRFTDCDCADAADHEQGSIRSE